MPDEIKESDLGKAWGWSNKLIEQDVKRDLCEVCRHYIKPGEQYISHSEPSAGFSRRRSTVYHYRHWPVCPVTKK